MLKKSKWPDNLKTLELIGKHVGVGAFKDVRDNRHSFTGPDGKPIQYKIITEYVDPGAVKDDE